ncbi:GNAT family N-acetyltransferase [Roseivirga sp.]|uniref:GNAT family N-acetyltransferase n=1 Tax=Roseivirga sp. TaxID=1964215 RepID=UPI003B523A40
MNYCIDLIAKEEYPAVLDVWETSVRATHHFLKEEDIAFFKPLILNEYLGAVELRCMRTQPGKIIGFLGVASNNLEMLFLHPDYHGQGLGKLMLDYAKEQMEIKYVDVNEQNAWAVGFYQHEGFEVYKRSALDSLGKPYPILHMQLSTFGI